MFSSVVLSIALTAIPAVAPADGIERSSAALSGAAQDMMGFEPSLYTGKWFDPKWEDSRKCIMHRESRFNYRAANSTSSARGAYQFLDSKWRDGLVWMLLPEARKAGLENEVEALRDIPIHKWNRYWQDAAFYTAWRHGEGAKHWHLEGLRRC